MIKYVSTNNPIKINIFMEPDFESLRGRVNNGFSGDILAVSLDERGVQLYTEDGNVMIYLCEKNERGYWETVEAHSANYLINDCESFNDLVGAVMSWL